MIDLIPSSEEQEVADSIAAFLSDNLPVERLRSDRGRRGKYEPEVWAQLAELGCFGLSLPEAQGGVGLTLAEETLAFREYGRYLVSPAMLGSVLAVRIAARAGRAELVTEILEGRLRAGIANALHGATLGMRGASGEFHLIDVRPGDLVVGWNDSGAALFGAGAFAGAETKASLDHSVSLARVNATNVEPLAWVSAQDEPLALVAAVLQAALLVGMQEAVRDMAVSQAQTRVQFGVPIGTFQGVKHKVADLGLWAEASWSQTIYAALALRAGAVDAAFQAHNAKLIASQSALEGSRVNIQLHGGMGFTAELNAHLFLKRSHLLINLGESTRELQKKLLTLPLAD